MKDRADPDARERAIEVARQDPPFGVSPEGAVAAVRDVLDAICDVCPECPPEE
jgi:acetyl-CoA acetyltransferase